MTDTLKILQDYDTRGLYLLFGVNNKDTKRLDDIRREYAIELGEISLIADNSKATGVATYFQADITRRTTRADGLLKEWNEIVTRLAEVLKR